mmetsp:Transcript_15199/g.25373  ORF Transcript_15199/g.25373 Transcript_15199/m.25373 type:complete len:305 (-) Transcript_15199:71-985(-)|eukprot:CAMPEP_0119312898 /NCGR_PEP_ID=MMETSP1333-20130426/27167_1 /TAXON_ID=418940 /ORGANISM="Scyphosphaera apsteinii, Strain RCC1455" /LENGTH=304 /DNA_ID=CAMNT_0007317591 /DNA_START=129 /DNA_END=1043 /DNA_ORIENTATION=-
MAGFVLLGGLARRAQHVVGLPVMTAAGHRALSTSGLDFSVYEKTQLAMMEEMCIIVDFDDCIVGKDTKKNVHLINGPCMRRGGLPHRAFSVFLFDECYNLLLQKRCKDKILFPEHWANTCCSHPLADGATFQGELIFGEANGEAGTILAARRKLMQELGLPLEVLPTPSFKFLSKVHYKAPLPGLDPKWGEHEVDHLLLCQRPRAEIDSALQLNPNEVSDVQWLAPHECRAFVESAWDPHAASGATCGELISPWFGAIERELLHPWWTTLKRGEAVAPDGKIHRLAGGVEAMQGDKGGAEPELP